MLTYGPTVSPPHRIPKADFVRVFPAEATATADLLGLDVKRLTFDYATVSGDPSPTIQFRTRIGTRNVCVAVTGAGDSLIAQMILDQRD
jgi:hypothetical protein